MNKNQNSKEQYIILYIWNELMIMLVKSALCNISMETLLWLSSYKIHNSWTEAKRGRQQYKTSIDFCCMKNKLWTYFRYMDFLEVFLYVASHSGNLRSLRVWFNWQLPFSSNPKGVVTWSIFEQFYFIIWGKILSCVYFAYLCW